MKTTVDIIEELADAFSKLTQAAPRELYIDALHALANMAKSEQLLHMQYDFHTAMGDMPVTSLWPLSNRAAGLGH